MLLSCQHALILKKQYQLQQLAVEYQVKYAIKVGNATSKSNKKQDFYAQISNNNVTYLVSHRDITFGNCFTLVMMKKHCNKGNSKCASESGKDANQRVGMSGRGTGTDFTDLPPEPLETITHVWDLS